VYALFIVALRTANWEKMSEALSVPYDKPFSGMRYGVQEEKHQSFLYQVAIGETRKTFVDKSLSQA
jgi:hypothetical protein